MGMQISRSICAEKKEKAIVRSSEEIFSKSVSRVIEAKGLTGKIAVVSTDFLPDLDVKLKTGAMAAESGGHYADPFFAFLMVYNAVRGKFEAKTDGFYDMVFPYMYVASPEDYAKYGEFFTGEALPYNADEIKALAEMSYEDLAAACAKLSVEDVVARHSK